MSCPLCNLEKKTQWYYEDDFVIVCDCLTCGIPIVVLKEHRMTLTKDEEKKIECLCKRLFGVYSFRREQRLVKDHLHWHIIRKGEM